jgi:hypothetical protein
LTLISQASSLEELSPPNFIAQLTTNATHFIGVKVLIKTPLFASIRAVLFGALKFEDDPSFQANDPSSHLDFFHNAKLFFPFTLFPDHQNTTQFDAILLFHPTTTQLVFAVLLCHHAIVAESHHSIVFPSHHPIAELLALLILLSFHPQIHELLPLTTLFSHHHTVIK